MVSAIIYLYDDDNCVREVNKSIKEIENILRVMIQPICMHAYKFIRA